ncbi:MAG: hypothetical protein ACI4MC_00330 [Candidatus Coproplasma sp.]
MKTGVIDIGSNSVRLMLWADGKTLYKKLHTTRLGEGLSFSTRLKKEAIERTVDAVADFNRQALADGAEEVYAFATAAVRSSENGGDFVSAAYDNCGIVVDVLTGEQEAAVALSGALGTGDGGLIDVGGASTEVTVRTGGKVIYSHSANVGTVRILDAAGRDLKKIKAFITGKIAEYGQEKFPFVKFCAVGGTASRLGAVKHNLTQYQPQIIDGTTLSATEIHGYAQRLTSLPVEEIKRTTICQSSADLIGGGAELLASVMDKFGVENITVSESDNLEGYLAEKILKRKAL